jgi:hypothetical protein
VSPKSYGLIAAVLFAAQAIFALVHLAMGGVYPSFTHVYSVVTDFVLAISWATAAVASLAPQNWPAPFLMMCGAAVSVMWGFVYTVATNDHEPSFVGVPFWAAAAVAFFCIYRAVPPLTPAEPKPAPSRRPWRAMAWVQRLRHAH